MKAFVLGEGIGYTLSPRIHRFIGQYLGEQVEYDVKDIAADRLSDIAAIAAGYDGFNVTKPFKQEIIKQLYKVDTHLQSVNTVVMREGRMYGYSTDGRGWVRDVKRHFGSLGNCAVVIGSGGAAHAIVPELVDRGVSTYVWARNYDRASSLAERFGAEAVKDCAGLMPDIIVGCITPTVSQPDIGQINTSRLKLYYDLVYNQQTQLMRRFSHVSRGGLGMLVYQAIFAYELFTGRTITEKKEDDVYDYVCMRIKEEI